MSTLLALLSTAAYLFAGTLAARWCYGRFRYADISGVLKEGKPLRVALAHAERERGVNTALAVILGMMFWPLTLAIWTGGGAVVHFIQGSGHRHPEERAAQERALERERAARTSALEREHGIGQEEW